MFNHRDPVEKAAVIYKNDLAKKDLDIQFKPVRETLSTYSN